MRPIEDVRSQVLASMPRLGPEAIDMVGSEGRILSEDVVAGEDVPPFSNSAMDGFAVRSADVGRPGAVLEIIEDVPAGKVAQQPVGEGEAIRIMTGAPIPGGADTVVRVEDTDEENGKVHIGVSVPKGTSVRPAGGDVLAGQVVLEAGTRITPPHVGVLATLGVTRPMVASRPRVALLSTGDELTPPETKSLDPGMIRDSNRPMLHGLLTDAGADVRDLGRVSDDEDALRAVIGRATAEADAIVISGGVSKGDYDVTKKVLGEEEGVDFMEVAMKPAKPFAFGVVGGKPFFGLPGNPVSVFVSFEQFVRPALLTMQGARAVLRPVAVGTAGETFETDLAKTVFVRVRFAGEGDELRVVSSGGQGSNVLSAMASADAFAVVPRGIAMVKEGERIRLELFRAQETRGQAGGV